jgi:hypothetical protein
VIAIENVRLFTELHESLEQQTATAEILGVINSSPGEVQPVFEAILERAMQACQADFGLFNMFDGRRFNTVATRGIPAAFAEYRKATPFDYSPVRPGAADCRRTIRSRRRREGGRALPAGDPNRRAIADLGGARSVLNVALRNDDAILGRLSSIARKCAPSRTSRLRFCKASGRKPSSPWRTPACSANSGSGPTTLQESLDYQTASSEVLEVIGRSTADVQPVFDTLLASAASLCGTDAGTVAIRQGEDFRYVATLGLPDDAARDLRAREFRVGRGTMAGRTLLEKQVVQVADLTAEPDYDLSQLVRANRWQTALGVPLMREGRVARGDHAHPRHVEPLRSVRSR